MPDMIWEAVLKAYQESPATSREIADRLQAQGCAVNASRVRKVLEATVLDEVSGDDIAIVARTLKLLVDLTDTDGAEATERNRQYSDNLTKSWQSIGRSNELDTLARTIARLLADYEYYSEVVEQLAYLDRKQEWRSRTGMAEAPDEEIPF